MFSLSIFKKIDSQYSNTNPTNTQQIIHVNIYYGFKLRIIFTSLSKHAKNDLLTYHQEG